MAFNRDPNKQAQEVVFSRQIKMTLQPPLTFINDSVKEVQFQKQFGVYLDGKLDLCKHLPNIFKKVNKAVSLLRKLRKFTYLELRQ